MELDPLLLSRFQFAFVVSFHAIFPVFTIGLASFIAFLQALSFKTSNPQWEQLSIFWTQVFAVVFAMGVVSGIVMAFQFGTNWSNFSYAAANFIGPTLSYEVVTAFFLEAGFLGVLLFGRSRVPPGVHLFAACMVAVGTLISAFWILATNSWLHTPAGTELRDGVFFVTSWREAIFNPSFPYRFTHMAIASFLTGAFVVAGVSAWYLLKDRNVEANRKALSMCLWMILFLAPTQAVVGDLHGLNTFKHQPMKVAAMEGNWDTDVGVPLLLFALPDRELQANRFEIGIPRLGSMLLTHTWDGEVPGLREIDVEDQPPVWIVFFAFRIMVAMGLLMIGFALTGLWLRRGGRYWRTPWFLHGLRFMSITPFIAVLAGWVVTEVGRAPWLVYEILRHEDGVTPSLTGGMALFTLIGYVLVYLAIFSAGLYYLFGVLQNGIHVQDERLSDHADQAERPKRPLSATHVRFEHEET
ncbi:MAG TPA: cytochrome ubiquinol oxidase subunit I [Pseudomonas xinjiangensis]|uniref:Cytochrome ubiquinol oxidase subunit I n=2 Tax=root TaxID=1 RepID=A0A7V1FSV3_9GAMM|nr:cytochrome ubiquinol oxidase subunit I [Halopseudomonas xinjiangensis]HEC47334.1 cytochrome ubiquinol oxidase subunit I [Halopseudomonas xinjiangensis]